MTWNKVLRLDNLIIYIYDKVVGIQQIYYLLLILEENIKLIIIAKLKSVFLVGYSLYTSHDESMHIDISYSIKKCLKSQKTIWFMLFNVMKTILIITYGCIQYLKQHYIW